MKRTLFFLILGILLPSSSLLAQIPTDYYLTAEDLADAPLKAALNQIIDGHTIFPYTSSGTDTWDILKDTDRDPDPMFPNNVIMLYSGVSIDGPQEYNSTNGWTREHVWAKSRGDFGTSNGAGTDVHALRPLDATTNSIRSNRGFDMCTSCTSVSDKWGNVTGSFRDSNDWSFQPRPEVRGDVARMLFYMAVRYEGIAEAGLSVIVDLELSETIEATTNKDPFHGKLSVLLDWHRNDPVDAWEENRNDIIYYSYQNNRNPFIDHPEIAEHLWGTKTGINWPEASLSTPEFTAEGISIFPNPASDFVHVKGLTETTSVVIYDALGRQVMVSELTKQQNSINIADLKGVYLMTLSSGNKTITKRIVAL